MSSVTNGKTLLEYAAQLEGKLHMDVPVSVKGSDLYILFGEKAFTNPLLLKASEEGSSLIKVLGMGRDKEDLRWLELLHACEWRESVVLDEVASRDPNDWLGYCSEHGGLNHIMWCLAHKSDVVSQYYWVHDILGLECEDLNSEFLDLLPVLGGANPQTSIEGVGYSRGADPWCKPTRRQSKNFYTPEGFPSSRKGKQPRGKSLSDKRRGNLNRSYQKAYRR